MAFNIQSFSRVSGSANNIVVTLQDGSYVGAPGIYTYVTHDTIATVSAANYFNLMAPVLNLGDLFFCTCSDGQVDLTVATIVVNPPAVTTTTGTSVGNVVGPASSLQYAVTIFSDTTGKLIEGLASLGNAGQVLISGGTGVRPAFGNVPDQTWIDQTTTPVTLTAHTAYSANNAGLVTFNMPATVAFGATFTISGQGAGGWLLQMNTGQTIHLGSSASTSAGSLASTNRYDSITLHCSVANTTFVVSSAIGNITVA